MANEHDSAMVIRVVAVQDDPALLIDCLERELPEALDDSVYWHLLLAAWMHNGQARFQERYRVLMQARRRNRIRGMKRASLAVWRRLPDPVVAFHGRESADEDVDRALAWTLDPAVARRFAQGREVECRAFPKRLVPFYTDRRAEREVIVLAAWEGAPRPLETPPALPLASIETSHNPGPQHLARRSAFPR